MAVKLTGSAYLRSATISGTLPLSTTAWTLGCRMYLRTAGGTYSAFNTGYAIRVSNSGDTDQFGLATYAGDTNYAEFGVATFASGDVATSVTQAFNTWQQVTIVCDPAATNKFSVYLNGTLHNSETNAVPTGAGNASFFQLGTIGDADIADAFLFSRALTSTEVGLINSGRWPEVSTTSLRGRWPLYSGTSTADISGNSLTLTANGSVADVPGTPGASAGMASAASGTLTVNTGSTAISSSAAGVASAATGAMIRATPAAGGVASAATGALTIAASIAAAGGVSSAATATPRNLIAATGAGSSAASGTLSVNTGTAISAAGGVASAATAAPVWVVTATGAGASAATGSLVRAIAATGASASAATLDLYQAGGLPSRFQGTQSFTRTVSIAGTQVHTLTAWFRATTSTSVDANVVQLANATDSDSSRIGVVDNSGTFSAVFVQHRTGVGSTAVLPAMSASQWHHMAIVVDGTNQVSYIDGVQVDSRAFDPSLRSTGFTSINIGQNFGGATPDNAIQDVQVYTSALSAADIKTVIRGGIPAGSTLYAHWMLQAGDPLRDISGNGRTLTQVGTWAGASFAPLYGPGGNNASAASAVPGTGAVALTATGAGASAATGALLWQTPATGGNASAATATATVTAALAAAGGVSSAATASTGLLLTASGGSASAATGTAAEAVALTAAGGIASASTGNTFSLGLGLTATGAQASAATGTAAEAVALAASGGVASAASGGIGGGIAATGSTASAATATLTAAAALAAAGGVASAANAGTGLLLAGTGASSSAGTGTGTEAVALTASGGVASAGVVAISGALQASGGLASAASGVTSVRFNLAATGGQASAATGTAAAAAALAAAGGVASAATNVVPLRSVSATGASRSAATANGVWGTTLVASGALQLAAAGVLAVSVALGASSAQASAATGTLTYVNPNAPIVSGWDDGGDVPDEPAAAGTWEPAFEADMAPHGKWAEDPVTGGDGTVWIAARGRGSSAGAGLLGRASIEPSLVATLGGAGTYSLAKNWVFGTNGNIGNAAALNSEFTYHDPFNTITNGANYGAQIVRAAGAPTFGVYNWADIGMANDQQLEDTTGRYRTFQSDSMLAHVKPLNTGSTVVGPASAHNAGCGSLVSKLTYPAGGTRLGQTIVWETRCRIVNAPNGYWFALWIVGPSWDGGPEIDVIEAFSSTSPNVNGDLWNSNGIGGSNSKNYFGGPWDNTISTLGFPGYALPNGAQSLRNWHVFTMEYKADNSFRMYMDSTLIQSGSLDWKVPTGSTVPTLQFLFDFGFGHTAISPINTAVISDINATPLTYEIAYSRIWLR